MTAPPRMAEGDGRLASYVNVKQILNIFTIEMWAAPLIHNVCRVLQVLRRSEHAWRCCIHS
jgi:hypothetical protein